MKATRQQSRRLSEAREDEKHARPNVLVFIFFCGLRRCGSSGSGCQHWNALSPAFYLCNSLCIREKERERERGKEESETKIPQLFCLLSLSTFL